MLGIDIVDLKDQRTKERNVRSLRLIQHEKDTLINHPHIFWLLWAAKEAVYKSKRKDTDFSPTSIRIKIKRNGQGFSFQSEDMEGMFRITKNYIVAACSKNLELIDYQIFESNHPISPREIRKKIIDYFKRNDQVLIVGADELNIPILLPSKSPISISHHNDLGAFAYPKSVLNQ